MTGKKLAFKYTLVVGPPPPSTSHPPYDVIHMISVPRPSLFFVALSLPCVRLNTNQKQGSRKWDYIYSVYAHRVFVHVRVCACATSDEPVTVICVNLPSVTHFGIFVLCYVDLSLHCLHCLY